LPGVRHSIERDVRDRIEKTFDGRGSTTPVIFNTVYDEPEIREEAIQSGCSAYLRKTASAEAVLAAVANAINELPPGEAK
jgi:DNA-binding NarL/FixJ family response regulator